MDKIDAQTPRRDQATVRYEQIYPWLGSSVWDGIHLILR